MGHVAGAHRTRWSMCSGGSAVGKGGAGPALGMEQRVGGRGMQWGTWGEGAGHVAGARFQRLGHGHAIGRVRPCSIGLFPPTSAFPPSLRSGEI